MPRDLDWNPPAPSPWADVYAEAANILENGHLAKFAQTDYRGGHCLIGALYVAHYGFAFPTTVLPNLEHSETWKLGAIWARDLGFGPPSKNPTDFDDLQDVSRMTSWNNAPERTRDDVIYRLRSRVSTATQPLEKELAHAI